MEKKGQGNSNLGPPGRKPNLTGGHEHGGGAKVF